MFCVGFFFFFYFPQIHFTQFFETLPSPSLLSHRIEQARWVSVKISLSFFDLGI